MDVNNFTLSPRDWLVFTKEQLFRFIMKFMSEKFLLAMRWFGAEFLVVVSGVLMAFVITALYENHQNNQIEAHYLNQLLSDLELSEEALERTMQAQKEAFDARTKIIRAFYKDTDITREEFFDLWSLSQRKHPLAVLDVTARALITTGDIKLIRDAQLRSELLKWMSGMEVMQARYLDYELMFRELGIEAGQLIDNGDIIALRMLSDNASGNEAAYVPESAETGPFGTEINHFLSDRDAYQSLYAQHGIAGNLIRWQKSAIEACRELSVIIKKKMEKQ